MQFAALDEMIPDSRRHRARNSFVRRHDIAVRGLFQSFDVGDEAMGPGRTRTTMQTERMRANDETADVSVDECA